MVNPYTSHDLNMDFTDEHQDTHRTARTQNVAKQPLKYKKKDCACIQV